MSNVNTMIKELESMKQVVSLLPTLTLTSVNLIKSLAERWVSILQNDFPNECQTVITPIVEADWSTWFNISNDRLITILDTWISAFSSAVAPIESAFDNIDVISVEAAAAIQHVSDLANDKDKMSWRRYGRELSKNLELIEPMYQELLILKNKMQPIENRIDIIRSKMVDECIHPQEELVYESDTNMVVCKFCKSRMKYRG